MSTIQQAFNFFNILTKSNIEKLHQIKKIISQFIRDTPINSSSIIKITGPECSKVYYLNDCCNGCRRVVLSFEFQVQTSNAPCKH